MFFLDFELNAIKSCSGRIFGTYSYSVNSLGKPQRKFFSGLFTKATKEFVSGLIRANIE